MRIEFFILKVSVPGYREAVRCGTMSVFHVRRDLFSISRVQDPDLTALFLVISLPLVTSRIRPAGCLCQLFLCAGLECYIASRAVDCPVIRNRHLKPCGPDKMIIGTFSPLWKITRSRETFDFVIWSPIPRSMIRFCTLSTRIPLLTALVVPTITSA